MKQINSGGVQNEWYRVGEGLRVIAEIVKRAVRAAPQKIIVRFMCTDLMREGNSQVG